ncbi:MAG TPA: glycosyltransferase [Terriglobia bacterium]|nr:glycosyltransferase [Terriglobia bacterium]
MKVLHLDSGLAFRGGQQQVLQLASGLARSGVDQQLVLRRGSAFERRAAEAKLTFTTLPFRSEGDLASALKLRTVIRRFQPQIVHAHDARTLGLAALAWAMGSGSPIIAARRVAFPLRRNPLSTMKYQSVARRIVAVSQFVRELLVASGIDKRRVDVVYDGFDLNGVTHGSIARQRLGVPSDACLIGCAGQFVAEKGHECLIRAFARISQVIPNAILVLIGDGELKEQYWRLVQHLDLEGKVLFPGFVPDLGSVLPALDVFVFPSLHEGLGSSLLVAMACEVPICASRTGGIPEIIQDGVTGYLFNPGDAAAIMQSVLDALQSLQRSRDLAEAAARAVAQKFSVARMVEATCEVYANVLRG